MNLGHASVIAELGSFEEENDQGGYERVNFRADAALIRELGERLVGAPHIALAELVKNAYDADATKCLIKLEAGRITVSDNGHGMTLDDFQSLWMTIGSTHKRARRTSPVFHRPVTGSKGVGRLAAQFLAHKLQLFTKSADEPRAVHALVDWDEASTANGLTEAEAKYREEDSARVEFPEDSATGTTVVLEQLNQSWSVEQVKELGRQLWMLNSPLPRFGRVASGRREDAFEILFATTLSGYDTEFAAQMRAAIDNWEAAIEGELRRDGDRSQSIVKVRFADGDTYSETFDHPGLIAAANWQIRVYRLIGRQPGGVSVNDAREYFAKFGVMLFDSGFRLPYYGKDSDWLGIDRDHALRLSHSKLLPGRLQVERGLNDLPNQGRLLGVVTVNTGKEEAEAGPEQLERNEYLQILVTRDRLVDNAAFGVVREAVRQSLDYYATRYRSREADRDAMFRKVEPPTATLRRVDALIEEALEKFPFDDTIAELKDAFVTLDTVVDQQRRADDKARALLGPLAAAGMAAIALEHENRREIITARATIAKLKRIAETHAIDTLSSAIEDMERWLDRLEASRSIFAPLLDDDERDRPEAFRAESVLSEVARSLATLLPNVDIRIEVPRDIRLPSATFAEWHALFQNVLVNAANAMLDVVQPRVLIRAYADGRRNRLHVSDIGAGIDLLGQARLFEPFNREQRTSEERAALGLGGMGLGLTIIRMIADQRGCNASFVEPEAGWNTTFELEWIPRSDEDIDL